MLSPWRGLALLLLTAGLMVLEPWSAHAEAEVDLALVLAVDVSLSMEPDEQDLQRQGFVEAFRSSEVHEAIGKGMLGRIAVVYVEWAGAGYQQVVVPWTVIERPARAVPLRPAWPRAPSSATATPPSRAPSTSASGSCGQAAFRPSGR